MTKLHNLKDLGRVFGIKAPKEKQKEVRKCPDCGQELRHIQGTNVWVCDWATMEDKTKNEQDVQVFTRCGHRECVA